MTKTARNITIAVVALGALAGAGVAVAYNRRVRNALAGSAGGAGSGTSATQSAEHGALVDDFEADNTDFASHVNLWRGHLAPSVDALGKSSMHASIESPGADGEGHCLRFSGTYGALVQPGQCLVGPCPPQVACNVNATRASNGSDGGAVLAVTQYPYVAMQIFLSHQDADGVANLAAYKTGLRFKAKAAASATLVVKLVHQPLLAYTQSNPDCANAYHYHAAKQAVTEAWATYSIPFTSFSWGSSWGPDTIGPTYASTNISSYLSQVARIQMEPANFSVGNGAPYDFSIDDVEFY